MAENGMQLFNLIFTNSSEAIFIIDLQGRIKSANPVAEMMLGDSQENLISGESWKFLNFRTGDGIPASQVVKQQIEKVIIQEKLRLQWLLVRDDGEVFNADVLLTYVESEQYIIVQMQDVSEFEKNKKLLKINRLILEEISQGVSLPIILNTICREIESMVMDSICTIMSVDENQKSIMLAAGPNVSDELALLLKELPIEKGYGSCGSSACSKAREFVENTFSDSRWEQIRDTAIQFGIKSCWSMPIIGIENEAIGTLALSQMDVGLPNDFQIRLLENISSLVGLAIQNDQRRKKMLEFAQQFRSIVNTLPDLIFILSAEGVYIQIYGGVPQQQLLLKESELLIGKNIKNVLPIDTAIKIQNVLSLTLATDSPQVIEYTLEVPIGKISFEGRASPIKLADGSDAVMWIARDITPK